MHLPGQGKGLVKTVTGVTPERVRMGFLVSFSKVSGSGLGVDSKYCFKTLDLELARIC